MNVAIIRMMMSSGLYVHGPGWKRHLEYSSLVLPSRLWCRVERHFEYPHCPPVSSTQQQSPISNTKPPTSQCIPLIYFTHIPSLQNLHPQLFSKSLSVTRKLQNGCWYNEGGNGQNIKQLAILCDKDCKYFIRSKIWSAARLVQTTRWWTDSGQNFCPLTPNGKLCHPQNPRFTQKIGV